MYKSRMYIKTIAKLSIIIALFTITLTIISYINIKEYDKHYEHAKTTYAKCLMVVSPELKEIEAIIEAENQLNVFKNEDTIVDIDKSLTEISLLIRNNDSLSKKYLGNIVQVNK